MALDRRSVRESLMARFTSDLSDLVKGFSYLEQGGGNLTKDKYPLLVLSIGSETLEDQGRNQRPIWRLHFDIYVYSSEGPTEENPDRRHNQIAAALEAALEVHPGEDDSSWYTTLGGTVSRAFPAGPVDYQSAEIVEQHKLIFPVEVIVPTTRAGRP